jgi:rhodanese-related sulfurtransferase
MKALLVLFALVASFLAVKQLLGGSVLDAAEAARRVDAGTAILVDVREPAEWTSGVAASAALLPLSDLKSGRQQWRAFLVDHRDKELILYCASGLRSGWAAGLLRKEGFRTQNAGSFQSWSAAGLPVRNP